MKLTDLQIKKDLSKKMDTSVDSNEKPGYMTRFPC